MLLIFYTLILFSSRVCANYFNNTADLSNNEIWTISQETPLPEAVLDRLQQFEEDGKLDIFSITEESATFMVYPSTKGNIKYDLEQMKMNIQEDVSDVARFVDDLESKEPSVSSVSLRANEISSTFYMTFDQIEKYLLSLRSTSDVLVQRTSIGKTFEGRDIWMISIQSKNVSATRAIFVEGGIHAREWISPAVTLYLIDSLINSQSLVNEVEFRIVPVANPDGYVYSHRKNRMWRKNRRINFGSRCVGVDLNRNWGYKFGGKGTSSNFCSEIYKGTHAFSEKETQALKNAMETTPNVMLVLAIHSYSQMMLYPWGYTYQDAPNKAKLKALASAFASEVKKVDGKWYRPMSAANLAIGAGATDDWAYGSLGAKYSFTLELRDNGKYGFQLPANQIRATQKEIWQGFKYLIKKIESE